MLAALAAFTLSLVAAPAMAQTRCKDGMVYDSASGKCVSKRGS